MVRLMTTKLYNELVNKEFIEVSQMDTEFSPDSIVLYIRNKSEQDSRISINTEKPQINFLEQNPSIKKKNELITFCLSSSEYIAPDCEHATEATGYIDIEGRWDLVLDNIVHLQNATALEISNYLNNTEDFIVTFDTDVEVRSEFDHLVLNYTWDEFNGVDLDTRSSISIPPRNVEVGWSRASNDLEYLTWAGDNTSSGGSESILINLKEIIKDYPSLDKIKIQLKAFWYNTVLDGKFKLSFISYKDGIMTPNNYTFTNEGGTLVDYFSIDCYTKSQDRNGETIGFLDFDLINNKGNLSLGSGPINTITAPTQLRADFTI